ncbi:hypothetical protein VTK73DRAFT_331 [Phialemonium thermophilum]|uniref:t-SNARE coiled-coil homology domain-containing protein n=1 Tax=Phialemonium thermophilum TaxID=223376 RepID=A0ABR3XEM9_9PEZI
MSYGNPYQSNPYGQAPSNEAGYGPGPEQHEMQPYGQSSPAAYTLSQQDFLARVAHIRNEIDALSSDVQQIASLHQRSLATGDTNVARQLETLVSQTQLRNTSIRDQIRSLKQDVERTTDASRGLKSRQFDALHSDFKKKLQAYLQEEQQYRESYREQISRQYRIVNPDASEEEVRHAADQDWGNEGIFQTALRTNRSGQASAVLGNVRARHNELQNIEKSLVELANLFQDLDTLVVQQDTMVQRMEEQTEDTNANIAKATQEVDKGIVHARRARRNKWICLGIVVLIIIAIALGVGLGVALTRKETSK